MAKTLALPPFILTRTPAYMRVSPALLAIIACLILAVLLTADQIGIVWRTGAFFDSDDAARAIQVRQWLAGQAWYDLTIARMDPPSGVFMHWSRVVDVPLAALVSLSKPLVGVDAAERLARLVFPAALFVALMAACGSAAAVIGGSRARVPGIVFCFLGAPFFGQFVPGRIDHHAPQIVLLVLMTGATLRAFAGNARAGVIAGLCAALSLSISLENLPFIAILASAFPLVFVTRGEAMRQTMLAFAGAFAAGLIVLFLAIVGPQHRGDASCDAYSVAHLTAGLAGCAALGGLGVVSQRLNDLRTRLLALAVCAPLPFIAVAIVAPVCLGDPFVGLDPLVRELWLQHVGEVEPLSSFLRTHVWSAMTMAVPIVAATFVAIVSAWRDNGIDRARHASLAALLLACLATSLWGIRVLSSGLPLVAIVAAPAVLRGAERLSRASLSRAARLCVVALTALPFAPLPLALALPADDAPAHGTGMRCLMPDALTPLAALTPGVVLAPIDLGAHIVAHTAHAAIAAPYHRNNHGNRLALDAFLTPPDAARAIVARSGATYVAICAGQTQMQRLSVRAPEGLAAQLLADHVPAWLHEVSRTPAMTIYAVSR